MTAKKAAVKKPAAPASNTNLDGDAALAILAGVVNAALESTAGVASGSTGTVAQRSAGATSTEGSHKMNTDVNTEESISTYNGLAVANNQAHLGRINVMSEQILQNAITQANTHVVNAQETANILGKQAVRNTDLATDRMWNIDEQIAAAETLYAALGRYINSTKVQVEE